MTEDYPSNSKTPKEEKPRPKQILTEPAEIRKKTVGRKFRETFIKGDATSVWAYVAGAVLVPAIKDMVADAGRQALEKMLYGEPRSASRYGRPTGTGSNAKFNYSGISSGSGNRATSGNQPPRTNSISNGRAFEDVVVAERGQAEMILDAMFDRTEAYGACTVADFYDMVGITAEYTDMNRGWRDLRGSEIIRIPEGHIFKFPKVEAIAR